MIVLDWIWFGLFSIISGCNAFKSIVCLSLVYVETNIPLGGYVANSQLGFDHETVLSSGFNPLGGYFHGDFKCKAQGGNHVGWDYYYITPSISWKFEIWLGTSEFGVDLNMTVLWNVEFH